MTTLLFCPNCSHLVGKHSDVAGSSDGHGCERCDCAYTQKLIYRLIIEKIGEEANALQAEVARLKKEHNDEIGEINMGHDACMAGVSIDDEPSDVWRMGWLWAQYIKTVSPPSPAPSHTPESVSFADAHAAVVQDYPTPAQWRIFERMKNRNLSSDTISGKDERQGKNGR